MLVTGPVSTTDVVIQFSFSEFVGELAEAPLVGGERRTVQRRPAPTTLHSLLGGVA